MSLDSSVLEDRRVWLLVKRLLGGRLQELRPVLDSSAPQGFRYPEAENLLECGPAEATERLKRLWEAGILEAELADVVLLCPSCGSPDLHPHRVCPRCGGARLERIDVIEHFPCGHIAPRRDFKGEKGVLRCPKCGAELEAEKQDYQMRRAVRCLDCQALSAEAKLAFRCYRCRKVVDDDEPVEREVHTYRLSQERRGDIIHYLGYHPRPEREKPSRRKRSEQLDGVDRRILNILQADGRLSFRSVARRLRVSDATVRERVARLLEREVIKGFSALVDPERAGMEVICLISVEADPEVAGQVAEELAEVEEVKLVMETGERRNLLVLGVFPSRDSLNEFLDQSLRGRRGVKLDSVTIALSLRKIDWTVRL